MKRNHMDIRFAALSENESFARVAVAAFLAHLDLTVEEMEEIKTVVSEAVTNAIIHGYEQDPEQLVYISTSIEGDRIEIVVEDKGIGIANLDEARQPLFTTKPEMERSGMGFTIMENFMDAVEVTTGVGQGTRIRMIKKVSPNKIYSQG